MVGAYGLLDTVLKGYQAWQQASAPPQRTACVMLTASVTTQRVATPLQRTEPRDQRSAAAAVAITDAAMWHAAASVVIPGVLINRSVWATKRALQRVGAPLHVVTALPTAVGLMMIPLLVHHIDDAVTRAMEQHVRPHLLSR